MRKRWAPKTPRRVGLIFHWIVRTLRKTFIAIQEETTICTGRINGSHLVKMATSLGSISRKMAINSHK